MTIVDIAKSKIGQQIRKKLGRSSEYGQRIYGSHEYGEYNDQFGLYRIRHIRDHYFGAGDKERGKQYTQKERFHIPTNPQTSSQQTNRAKFTNAITAWQALTPSQKDVYNQRAKYKNFSGYNLYITEYMLS